MSKNKKFLIVYFIVIAILLVCIMFLLPDSFFSRKYDANYEKYFGNVENPQTERPRKEFVDYEKQKDNLINGNYSYKYNLLQSKYRYECSGEIRDRKETGECTLPESITYDQKSKKNAFSNINIDYITPSTIFDLLKNAEPTLNTYNNYREYKYNIKINNLDTEVIVHTTLSEINQISISNLSMTYLLKYEGLKVDN